jgi:Mg2+ and Co2+ transporter CorA
MAELDYTKLPDHDILLILHTKVEGMTATVDRIDRNTTSQLDNLENRVDAVEKGKTEKTTSDQLARRIGRLENYLWFAFGALAVLQIVLKFWKPS